MIPVPPESLQSEVKIVKELLRMMVATSGLQLEFMIAAGAKQDSPDANVPKSNHTSTEGRISVEFTGPDTPMLTARNGELLNALEHIAAKALQLEEQEHDRVIFDADAYKVNRDRELRRLADTAIESVRSTGRPYAFRPMTSHERRLLHLLLAESGLPTASSGETPRRFVMLYPEGYEPGSNRPMGTGIQTVPVGDRVNAIRSSFRRR